MPFSQKIKQEILVLSARHCCVCHKSKGIKLEVHHISPQLQGGLDTFENAIALCFDCHSDAGHYFAGHPKGLKFSPAELLRHKEEWFKIVRENKIYNNDETASRKSIAQVKYKLKMQRKVLKELIDHKSVKENTIIRYYIYNPSHIFISLKVIIRSVNDKMYPNFYPDSDSIDGWFKVMIYNLYHNGIELWLDAGMGQKALMDKDGYWELLEDRYDPRTKNSEYYVLDTKMIAQIPFASIVDLDRDGDEYYAEPHIYCKFEHNGTPYENIYYKSFGNPQKEIPDITLDKKMMTIFPLS